MKPRDVPTDSGQRSGEAVARGSSTDPGEGSGAEIACFTGKMANYFRVCGIPYELRHMQFPRDDKIRKREVGVTQMSNVELADATRFLRRLVKPGGSGLMSLIVRVFG